MPGTSSRCPVASPPLVLGCPLWVPHSLAVWRKVTQGSSSISIAVIKHSDKKPPRARWLHPQQPQHLRLRDVEEGPERLERSQKNREFAMRLHLLRRAEAKSIKPHHHDCPNES